MTKLEKFKRRFIRSVATLLIVEKKPEDEIWDTLKEEVGRNCKVLWERLRALTLKKLKRLLAAQDKKSLIPKFTQMSDTDWLLFDLIITHEDEDVIGKDEWYANGSNSKVLTDLFTLVQRFNIEDEKAEKLAEAWTAATIYYNSSGHHCSPMLMQRRWYQLKQCTRQRFYEFWYAYRGSLRFWDEVQDLKPNELQQAIANRYPEIVTAPFPPWEELIDCRLVILPEEFEKCKNKTDLPKPCDENSPDLLLLEPAIETIDLEEYISDEEKSEQEISNSKGLPSDEESMVSNKIKIEPEDVYTNNEIEEEQSFKSHISMEVMSSLEQEETLLDMNNDMEGIEIKEMYLENVAYSDENQIPESDINSEEKNISLTAITKPIQEDIPIVVRDTISEITSVTTTDSLQENISNVTNEGFQQDTLENISESFEEGIPKITNVFGNVDIMNEDLIHSLTQHTKNLVEKPHLNIMPISENEKDCETINLDDSSDTDDIYVPKVSSAPSDGNSEEAVVKNPSPSPRDSTTLEPSNDNENEEKIKTKQLLFGGLRNYFDFTEDGIELADDGIEYVEDDELEERTNFYTPNKIESENNEDPSDSDEAKFDLKLLMQTTVYTTKLDDMKTLKDKSFHSVESQSLIDSITFESKPVCSKSLYIPNYMNTDCSENDDILINDDYDDDEVDDAERVEMSSNLLKKPKNRIYNPIKLCKNPDFNTRLKRLTVGFLSSSRNRFLLKICKPMTIDLSKAFESKLVNGSIYLKNSNTMIETKNDGNDNKSASVVPSAMSVQSLIDNMIVKTLPPELKSNKNPQLVCSFDGSLAERNKIVSLPDMNKVRVINQQLLTAEVTPFRVQNQTGNNTKLNYNTNPAVPLEKKINNYNGIEVDSQPLISDNRGQILKDTSVVYKAVHLTNTSNLVINDKETEEQSVPCYSINKPDKPNLTPSGSSSSTQNCLMNKISKKNYYNNPYKQAPRRCLPSRENVSWLKNITYSKKDDALITIDTLYKMLSHIDGSNDATAPMKNKVDSKKGQKLKKLQKLQDKTKETVNNNTPDKQNDTLVSDTEPNVNNLKKPKITVLFAKHENDYKSLECCWARTRINQKKSKIKKYYFQHTCKRNQCTCCCKNELKELFTTLRAEIALKRACDSIESVVQQTRELIAVQTTEVIKPITETVAVQTHIDLSDDPSDNELSDTSKSEQVTSTDGSDSNKTSSIDVTGKNYENIHTQDKNTCISLETNNVKQVPEVENRAPVVNATCIDHVEVLQSVQNIQISASTTELVRNDKSKLSKRKISICAQNYSQKYTDSSCQQFNNQLNDNSNTNINVIKQYKKEKNPKERILILNRRHLSKSRAENPIYLGKNKILVTNVKIPSPIVGNKETPKKLEDMQFPTAVPKGVQLMLSPTGELICNLLPGVEIDTNSLSKIPSIMAAVQTQLNLAGGSLPSHDELPKISMSQTDSEEVLDLCENESEPSKEGNMENYQLVSSIEEGTLISNNETNFAQDTSSQQVIELEQRKPSSEEQLSTISTNNKQSILEDKIENTNDNEINSASQFVNVMSENVQLSTKDEHTLNEPSKTKQQTIRTTENSEENATKTERNDALSTNRKTLLSDLMEMSGISAEDVAPTGNISTQLVEIPPLIPSSSRAPLSTVDSPTSDVPISVNYSSIENNIIPLLHVPLTDPEGKNETLSLPQLNTITSYSELKYACENQGSFYKLDYKTGTIIPITVCIKKTKRTPAINSGSVIDLTEEKDDTLEDPKDDVQPNENPKRHLIMKTVKAKPLKIFRAIRRPNILKKQISLLSKRKTVEQLTTSLLKPKVNAVNSDNSTDKICIINSSDDESKKNKRTYASDSSDDEPLISIVKRKKIEKEKEKSNENEITNLVEMKEHSNKIGEPSMEVIPAEEEFVKESPENDMMNDDSEISTTLSIFLDNMDADEDCILGV